MNNKLLLYLTIFITLVWMVIIYSFSASPSDESNSKSKEIVRYIVKIVYKDEEKIEKEVNKYNKPLRKFAHASVYFVLASFINSVICVIKKDKLWLCNIISIIICFIYACTDEFHQTFVSQRTGQISDVLIDTVGAIIGCMVFNFIYKKVKRKNYENKIHLNENN